MSEEVKKLTGKQQAFVDEYICDFNASRAAIAAGYSKKTAKATGSENMTKPAIQAAVQEAIEAREKRVHRTADEVINLLWAATELDPIEYCKIVEGGEVQMLPLDEIKPEVRIMLRKIKQKHKITESADGSKMFCENDLEYSIPSFEKMIELLMKHHGLLIDRGELTGKDGEPLIPEDMTGMVSVKQIIADIAAGYIPGKLWNDGDMPPKPISGGNVG